MLSEWVCCPPEKILSASVYKYVGGFPEETFSEEISQKIFPGNYRKIFTEDFRQWQQKKPQKIFLFPAGIFFGRKFSAENPQQSRQIFRKKSVCFSAGNSSENMRKIPVRCDLLKGKRSEDFLPWVFLRKEKIGKFAER